MKRPAWCVTTEARPNQSERVRFLVANLELPPIEFIRQCLSYDIETGKMYWHTRPVSMFKDDSRWTAAQAAARWNTRYAGAEAFTAYDGYGYKVGALGGRTYRAHRIAWVVCHGAWPDHVDHINGDRADNRIENLRSVTQADNVRNASISIRNTSGRTGVSWYARLGMWRAYIATGDGVKHLGYFHTLDDAALARSNAEASNGYHANHGRRVTIGKDGWPVE